MPTIPTAEDGTADPVVVLTALLFADASLDQCDGARASCVRCIRRARDAGAIK
ncbi:MAG: hypothetical protein KAX77_01290 [Xanthomonadales bacterium]|nr:hypothetical protein [Xanthomonadales bacterium]